MKKLVPAAIRNNAGIPSHLGNITAPRTRSLELESELERDCPRMLKVSNNAAPATMQMIPYETFDDMGLNRFHKRCFPISRLLVGGRRQVGCVNKK